MVDCLVIHMFVMSKYRSLTVWRYMRVYKISFKCLLLTGDVNVYDICVCKYCLLCVCW